MLYTYIQVSLFFDLLYAMCRKDSTDSLIPTKVSAERHKVQYKWSLLRQVLADLKIKTGIYCYCSSKSTY